MPSCRSWWLKFPLAWEGFTARCLELCVSTKTAKQMREERFPLRFFSSRCRRSNRPDPLRGWGYIFPRPPDR